MDKSSSPGTVLITGSSTGIGKVCALYLERAGFRVFAGVRKETDAMALEKESSGGLIPVYMDITDGKSVRSAVKVVSASTGGAGIQGLVNNAGISVGGLFEFLTIGDIRRQLEVNVIGHSRVTQAFLPMIRQGSGRIVFMGSITGIMPQPFLSVYSASKAALEAITDSLRLELRPWNVPVSIIEPSIIKTPMWDKARDAAYRTVENFPRRAHELYGPAIRAVLNVLDHPGRIARVATPADKVAKAVEHALTSERPRYHYIVGWDAKLSYVIAKFAPERMRDWIIMFLWRRLGLKDEV